MSNWISSKLKVAENFFEQIDQQAADSLKKNDKTRSEEDYPVSVSAKSPGVGAVSLKDQLKKRPSDVITNSIGRRENSSSNSNGGSNDSISTVKGVRDERFVSRSSNGSDSGAIMGRDSFVLSRSPPKPKPTLSDSDWTELLSSPAKNLSSSKSNAISGIGVLRNVGSGRKVDPKKGTAKPGTKFGNELKSSKALDVVPVKVDEKIHKGEEHAECGRSSSVDWSSGDKLIDANVDNEKEQRTCTGSNHSASEPKIFVVEAGESYPVVEKVSEAKSYKNTDFGRGKGSDGDSEYQRLSDNVHNSLEPAMLSLKHVKNGLATSSTSDDDSDSDSGSDSSSNSDSERERSRRKSLLAERAAEKALEVIKERENIVAKLEGEKLSLEKRLEEQAKQQAKEALELQTNMIETIEAAELEKLKHNSTRKEALIRLSKLEIANAHQARYLATMEKDLELEVNQIAVLREQMEQKESTLQELTAVFDHHNRETSSGDIRETRGFGVEREILEAEHSFLADKLVALEEKYRKLEENMEVTKREIEEPTEVEVELKRRLDLLTDHLIQKQAQVEALSSEKATLVMRIERVSRLLEENKQTNHAKDLEAGMWVTTNFNVRPIIEKRILAGRDHLGSMVQQLDSLFTVGAVFLRRNSRAKFLSLFYLVCLHSWVAYILFAHSRPPHMKAP